MSKAFVAILMGSHSDREVMQHCKATCHSLGLDCETRVLSAHRTPAALSAYLQQATDRGCFAFIAAAGMAAHLAGSVAAQSTLPVIGVPLVASDLGGMDALLSTVQMPGGMPVACMAIGKPGAKNAAFFAAQIHALSNPEIRLRLQKQREQQARAILEQAAVS
jgi:5-(carboxyamino)imidazole ribonucleotide mutase